jgi:hypothetical protein
MDPGSCENFLEFEVQDTKRKIKPNRILNFWIFNMQPPEFRGLTYKS